MSTSLQRQHNSVSPQSDSTVKKPYRSGSLTTVLCPSRLPIYVARVEVGCHSISTLQSNISSIRFMFFFGFFLLSSVPVKIVETDNLNPVFCFRNIQSGIRRNSSCYITFVNNGFQDVYGGNFQTVNHFQHTFLQ